MADEYVIVEKSTLDSIGDTVRNATGSTDSISVNNLNDAVAAAVTSGGVLIDSSLTQSGYAADAKATGDAISSLSEDKANQSDVDELKGDLGELESAIDITEQYLDSTKWITGKYYASVNGNVVEASHDSYKVYPPFEIKKGTYYFANTGKLFTFFVHGSEAPIKPIEGQTESFTIQNDGIMYVTASLAISNETIMISNKPITDYFYGKRFEGKEVVSKVDALYERVDSVDADLARIAIRTGANVQYLNSEAWLESKYYNIVDNNVALVDGASEYHAHPPIKLDKGKYYWNSLSESFTFFVGESGTISNPITSGSITFEVTESGTLYCTSGYNKVVNTVTVSIEPIDSYFYGIKFAEESYDITASIIDMVENVIFIGDSVTWGLVEDKPAIAKANNMFSWATKLCKKTGWKPRISSTVGANAKTWLADSWDKQTYETYQIAFIEFGCNGGLTDTVSTDIVPYSDYNDYADTTTGNYGKVIAKLKEANPNIQIILIASTQFPNSYKSAINDLVNHFGLLGWVDLTTTELTGRKYHGFSDDALTTVDYTHFTMLGYQRKGEIILDKTKEMLRNHSDYVIEMLSKQYMSYVPNVWTY